MNAGADGIAQCIVELGAAGSVDTIVDVIFGMDSVCRVGEH